MRHAIAITLCLAAAAAHADSASRPTTPQEKAYSLKIKKALRASIDGIVRNSDWTLINDGPMAPDASAMPDQQSQPYVVNCTASLTIKPESARAQRLNQASESIAEEGAKQMQAGKLPSDADNDRMNMIIQEQQPTVGFWTNQATGIFTFADGPGGKWQKIAVPGAKYAARATRVQGAGGGESDATLLYLGSFGEPRQNEQGAIAADGGLKTGAANELVLQNILIRMQAPAAPADELIRNLDLQSLNALIGK